MGRKLFSFLLALQFVVGCTNNGGTTAATPYSYPPPLILSNLTITSDRPIEYTTSNFTNPTNDTGLNLARPSGGSATGSCIATYNSTPLTNVDNSLSVAPFNAASLALGMDTTVDQSVNFNVSYANTLSSCYGEGLLFGLACSIGGFSATLVNLLSGGSGLLWIVGDDGYGSNALTGSKWTQTLGANLNANNVTDSADIIGTYQGKVYFSGASAGIQKLYRSNGSHVQQVTQFNAAGVDDLIGGSGAEFLGSFYFSASNGVGSNKVLYRLNNDDTVQQVSIDAVDAKDFAVYQGKLYFSGLVGNPALGVRKLLSYDGSTLCQVSNIRGALTDSIGQVAVNINTNKLYFVASAGVEQAVMSYDGTTIQRLTNTHPGGDDGITDFKVVGSSLFLGANNTSGYNKLFELTATQALQTSNLNGNSASDDVIVMSNLTNVYFTGNNGSNFKLYTINNAQIVQMSNLSAGNDKFYQLGRYDIPAGELWAQYVSSTGDTALVQISNSFIEIYTQTAWYQNLTGISSGVNNFTKIAKIGDRYFYTNTVSSAAPPATNTKLYLMKR